MKFGFKFGFLGKGSGGGGNVIPSNLVINGGFSNGANNWISMKEANGVGLTINGEGYQTVTTEIDATYKFNCQCDRSGVSPSISIKDKLPTGISLLVIHPTGTGWNTYTGEFTALSLESVIHFGNGSNTALFDNVSIKAIALGTTPSMPDSSTKIVLDDVAVLGYPDIVDRTNCVFKVITEITDDAEDTAEYDAWVTCSGGSGAGGQTIDLDGDSNPDVLIYQDGNITVTEDMDSINIDLNDDGVADIVVKK